jgi:RimJ/RimL family protein N-acetyltransferase
MTLFKVFKSSKIKIIKTMITRGHLDLFIKEISRRIFSDDYFICLSRDLTIPIVHRSNEIELSLRTLYKGDISQLIDINLPKLSAIEFKDRSIRLLMYESNIQGCYITVTNDDKPCHIIWLIKPDENKIIKEFFNGGFPHLKEDEVLIEGLYTHPDYRGEKIMINSLYKILQKGTELGYRRAIAFVRHSNVPSLKGFKKAGFFPYMIRKDKWRIFKRKVIYDSFSASMYETLYNKLILDEKIVPYKKI